MRAPLLLQTCKIAAELIRTSLAEAFPAQGNLAKTWLTCSASPETHRDKVQIQTKLELNQLLLQLPLQINHLLEPKKSRLPKQVNPEICRGQPDTTSNPTLSRSITLTKIAPLIHPPISLRLKARRQLTTLETFASLRWSARLHWCRNR